MAKKVASHFFGEIKVYGVPSDFRNAVREEPLPALVLMDIHIGDLHNGIGEVDFLKQLGGDFKKIPVVMVTSSRDPALHAFAREVGAAEIIIKPISADKLSAVLVKLELLNVLAGS